MRRRLILTIVLLSSALALSGCLDRTGDVGNKNIRPYTANKYGVDNKETNKMRFANDQDNEQNRMYGERRENNNVIGMHSNSRIEMSDKVANKLAASPEIDTAFVVLTDHNAYVAVTQSDKVKSTKSNQLTNALKDKIADQVKSMAPTVENVYVSANPDFISRMKGYASDVRQGHPIQGLIVEFNALVERVFPERFSNSNR
jgi:YhcN/YlaJ family sporulation lipoprotein